MAIEICLFLELLDVVAIRARVHLPVDRRDVVAVDVLAILGELNAEALERTAMEPRKQAFDNRARLELERAQPRNDRRIEEPARRRRLSHDHSPLFGIGTVSISLSTMTSGVMRSDSA